MKESCNMLMDTLSILTTTEDGDDLADIAKSIIEKKHQLEDSRKQVVEQNTLHILRNTFHIDEADLQNDNNRQLYLYVYNQVDKQITHEDSLDFSKLIPECSGYDQFVQSIHCQFFHSESSFFSLSDFQPYFRLLCRTAAKMMNKVIEVYGRNILAIEGYPPLMKFVYHILNSIDAITQDARDCLCSLFDIVQTEEGDVMVPCDEFIEFLDAYQVFFSFSFYYSVLC